MLAGGAYISNAYNFALARYNPNGTLDTGFGTGSKVITNFPTPNPNANATANSIALQPDWEDRRGWSCRIRYRTGALQQFRRPRHQLRHWR